MRKLMIATGLMAAAMLASCSGETEKAKSARDSVENVNMQQQVLLDDLTATLAEVSAGLDSIAATQGMLRRGGEDKGLTRRQMMENLNALKQMMAENRQKLDRMEGLLAQRDDKLGRLSALVAHLSRELDEREATIDRLTKVVGDQKNTIEDLEAVVERNEMVIGEMEEENVQQRELLTKQDAELNSAYYVVGSSKELRDKGLLKGGFLKKDRVDFSKVDKRLFTKIDRRLVADITIAARSARVLSGQPEDSYKIYEKDKNSCLLKITDREKFWNVSNVLIIETRQ
ncbi:MAG: hypothetical protein IJ551_12230 [Prevotella sp.]|nr:hypothetical protein [Prevotella sp.]